MGRSFADPDKTVPLSTKWLERNFNEPFLQKVVDGGVQNKFLPVPVGNSKKQGEIKWNVSWGDRNKMVKNEFLQGENSSCLFSSLACALAQQVFLDKARQLHLAGINLQGSPGLVALFLDTVKTIFGPWEVKGFQAELNILRNRSGSLTIAILEGSDGSNNPAVTVCQHLLFDSNSEHTLPLQQEVLDWYVSDAKTEVKFVRVLHAWRFVVPPKRKKEKKEMRRSELYSRK